jgi:multidrug efflux pump subunit AcrB
MWIVKIALRRPYTFIVMAIVLMLATPLAIQRTPVDVLPNIDIPVISVIWSFSGLSAQQMEQRVTQIHERALTVTVNGIEHIESQSLAGVAVIKIYFQPKVNIELALAQVVGNAQTVTRQMPPGMTPPIIIKYTASSVPVIQIGMSSKNLSEQELLDSAVSKMRPQLVTIPGVVVPYPSGGKIGVISVDIDPQALLARGLSSSDVVRAISAQNLTLPAGTVKIGDTEYNVATNASPDSLEGLNAIPVKSAGGATVFLRDVAHVRDGFAPQTNIVRQNGQRGMLLSVMKGGEASSLEVVDSLKQRLPDMMALLPEGVDTKLLFDQSVFVKAAARAVIDEALIAVALTAILLLLFMGNWRTTFIIAVTIPLSIFASLMCLYMMGETINLMTLGGLALAVGILVDDATVTVENIERYLHDGADLQAAILGGAAEIAGPALVSTLCICIVFIPMFFLQGVARFLFVPLAEAVIFAMLASYLLSRTLVPTMAALLMGRQGRRHRPASLLHRVHAGFERRFEKLRAHYLVLLAYLLGYKVRFLSGFLAFCLLSCGLFGLLGRELFPPVDSGQIKLHVRAPSGTRIEQTMLITDQAEALVRTIIPAEQLDTVADIIGLPYSGINISYSNSGTIGSFDADILISLKPGHRPSAVYIEQLSARLRQAMPGVEFFFQPADIITQTLNFGAPAAIDVQISGTNAAASAQLAGKLAARMQAVPGAADVHVHQRLDYPSITLKMDRLRMQGLGYSPSDVAQNLLVPLSGSSQTAPSFWLNPKSGTVHNLQVQTEQHKIASLDELLRLPVGAAAGAGADPLKTSQLMGNLVEAEPGSVVALASHYSGRPVIDIYADARGRDLGGVAGDIERILDQAKPELARGSTLTLRGQAQTMASSYRALGLGIGMAVVLVYLLIVVNFQSWTDPLIIISALPAALAGIAWMLVGTGTDLSIPVLTGAIMTMGVATANSILLVSFARQRLHDGLSALEAALDAGKTRLRPVLITALAMVLGMLPVAIGLGEGAEQNAPLGRAVIGGLLFGTAATLLFVPLLFASFHGWRAARQHTPSTEILP